MFGLFAVYAVRAVQSDGRVGAELESPGRVGAGPRGGAAGRAGGAARRTGAGEGQRRGGRR